MVVGHAEVFHRLSEEDQLPPAVLLLGPESVGKYTLAEEVCEARGIRGVLLRRYGRSKPPVLRVSDAREIISFTSRRSASPKGIVIRLDGVVEEALNALLKVLEEPPPQTHFFLCSSGRPLLTISSRSQVYRCGYLTDQEIATVLVAAYGMSLDRAEVAARSSGGQVLRAREAARYEETKGPVLSALHAVAEGDAELFENAVGGKRDIEVNGVAERVDAFGSVQLGLLLRWATEALTGRWRTFSPSESYGLQRDPRVARRVLAMDHVLRPRLAVRAALQPFVIERSLRGAPS